MKLRVLLPSLCFLLLSPLGLLAQSDPAARTLLIDATLVASGPESSLVAVGERGAVLRSTDKGETWQRVPAPATAMLTGVSFAPHSAHGWAAGHDATVLHTTDGGATWTAQRPTDDIGTSFLAVLALDPQTALVVGAFGQSFATHDGGQTWAPFRPSEEDLHLNTLALTPDGTLVLAGERGLLLRSTDRGATWQPAESPYESSFYGLLALGEGRLLAVGLRGRIVASDDSGQTWQPVANASTALLATAARLPDGTLVLAGQARAFLASRDGGRTFTAWSPDLTTAVSKLLVAPDGALFAFGEAGVTRLPAP